MGKGTHTIRRMIGRWMVVTITAYALFLQSLAMASASAARAGEPGGFVLLCSGTMTVDPAAPDGEPKARGMGPCALCGLGHAVLDLPRRFALPLPRNVVETLVLAPVREQWADEPLFLSVGRPRGPPVFI